MIWTEAGVCDAEPVSAADRLLLLSGRILPRAAAGRLLLGVWTMFGPCARRIRARRPAWSLIPAGTFTMGSPGNEPGRDSGEVQHQVTLTHAMYVSKYEVTQSEWQAVMGWNTSTSRARIVRWRP